MSAPLANGQKAYLAQLARRAGNLVAARARGRGEEWSLTDEQFRHQEVVKACGKEGLRCCSQDDYKTVEAHFLELIGDHARAFNAQVRAATEERRVIEYKITEACKEFGFHLSYADKICRAQNHGMGLDEVNEKTLWKVFYTIRTRGNKRIKKAHLVVRWRGFGVRFYTNVCGKVYSLVALGDGTLFETPLAAAKACRECNLMPSDYEIVDWPKLEGDAA